MLGKYFEKSQVMDVNDISEDGAVSAVEEEMEVTIVNSFN